MSRSKTRCDALNTTIPQGELWILIDSLTYGGIETHVVELAHGLKRYYRLKSYSRLKNDYGLKSYYALEPNHNVDTVHDLDINHDLNNRHQTVRVVLVERYDQSAAIIDKLRAHSIPYSYLDELNASSTTKITAKQPNILRQLIAAINCYRPRLIHAHGYKASIYSKLCKLHTRHRFKQVTTFHAGETPAGKVKWYDRLDRYSAFLSDVCLSVSPSIQRKVPHKSHVLNNFISLPHTHSPISINAQSHPVQQNHTTSKQIAFVGRLSHEKGPDRFIELAKQCPTLCFCLYGDGDMRNSLESNASTNVKFAGFQPNMADCWHNIDILLMTSRYEGLPMTAIEAMARGIPVISLNVGAISTLITHKHNGWLVKDMAEMLQCLMEWQKMDRFAQQEIQSNAYKTIEQRFSSDAVIPKIIQLYS
ncbi:glycosyltransferase family 1 protein [Vibrio alfacsensis]|uniref:Glycosyltransferase family 1 protein n=1 Tax=Vibrio alfacsensis TaxID=1074311 RepID=A0ABN5PCP6_9VIBR|nr:glycosyltransferase family 4 protein [Vibrio alfacsensis]AXY01099.1 glycosyltransferase family 1 protein [Vibrio alfacsensis]